MGTATATQLPIRRRIKASVETYLHSTCEPDAEYIDGEIQERPMPDDDHSAFQIAICNWFIQHAVEWNIRVRSELRIQIHTDKYLIPDVSILDAALPKEKVPTIPPLVAFEVWSEDNRVREMMRKFDDYERMGIPQIWFIDPAEAIWQRYQHGKLSDQTHFSLPERGIEFEMTEITSLVR
jgi:Uma2 family endonuclease